VKRWQLVMAGALLVSAGVFGATQVSTVGGGKSPVIATGAEGRLHLAYQGLQAGSNIFYRHSEDGGHTWSEETDISNTPDVSHYPSIAAAGERVAVAWLEDCRDHSGNDVYLVTSPDGGKTWSKAMDVSHTPGHSAHPVVAIGPHGSIHVAWSDTTEGKKKPDIYYSSSDNGGQSWTHAIDVSKTHGVYGPPAMVVEPVSGLVHIAWADYCSGSNHDIHVIRGMQDSWSKPRDISHTNYRSSHPSLALAANNRLCATWLEDCTDHPGNDVWYAHSDEFADHFSKPVDLSRTPGHSSDPYVVSDRQGNVVVSWIDDTRHHKAPDVWQARSSNGGAKFSGSQNLTRTPGKSHEPHTTLLGGKPVVVWEEVSQGKSWIKVAPVKVPLD
jgi:hypothetical protein